MQDFHLMMEDLGELLDTTLIPDKKGACVLNFNDEVRVQIEPDAPGLHLYLAAEIGEIPAGKFRENLLAAGLRYNATYPRLGTFAYLARKNLLVFYYVFDFEGLKATQIAEAIPLFVTIATEWKQDVARGAIPVIKAGTQEKKPSIFDLKR